MTPLPFRVIFLERALQRMKDRRGFQIFDGFLQSHGTRTQQRASLAQGIPRDTAESVSYLLQKQAGNSLASALKISERRLSALLHDRSRIGRELHDSVLQALYAIGLSLAQSLELRRSKPPALLRSQGQATDQLNKLIQVIRRMILSVESDSVDPFRLVSELQALAQTVERVSEVRIRVGVDPAAEEILTGEEARELVTITREALNNCVRHARATRIVISLRHIGSRVQLSIRDNGSGFDVEHGAAKGIGFTHMKDRVRKIGGRLDIQSTVGRGTCIIAHVYLEPILTTV
ncbi:MAG TPA: ATP-binding protein [Nitrospiraceae bacterium]|nr:ATP-binding protein [Nitrospiraceae bacterium]